MSTLSSILPTEFRNVAEPGHRGFTDKQQQFAESVDFIQTMSRTLFLKQAGAPINHAASLLLLFVVTVDAFGFRFGKSVYVVVYLRLLASLRFVLDPLLFILMEFIFTTVKIISGGDHQFQIFI